MRALHRAVLRTRAVPGLRGLYRGVYAAAAAGAAVSLHGVKGTAAVVLHRGLSRPGWEPGVSDIDLVLVARRFDGPDEQKEFLGRLGPRLAGLKAFIPMLGETWIGDEAEVRAYLRWGGLRAREDSLSWRFLRGQPPAMPAPASSPEKRRRLDPWVWAFVSHMEVSRRYFLPSGLPEKENADLRKLYLDACRYAGFALDPDPDAEAPSTRAEESRRRPDTPERPAHELWLETALLLERASEAVLTRLSSGMETARPPGPAAASEDLADLRRRSRAAACVLDLPYHLYLLAGRGWGEGDYARAASALRAQRLPAVPLVLGPASWALALQSSYLGAPLGWMGARSSGPAPAAPSAGWRPSVLGVLPRTVAALPTRLRWETAAEAASWMRLWWRTLWLSPAPNSFVLRHLATRALGLRLELAGTSPGPWSDWEGLLRRARRAGAGFGPLRELRGLGPEDSLESLDRSPRAALDPAFFDALANLMDGFGPALEDPESAYPRPSHGPAGSATVPLAALFTGNSLTYHEEALGNGDRAVHDIPALLSGMSGGTPANPGLAVERLAAAGASLQGHWESGRFQMKLASRRWDFVVLQDLSARPLDAPCLLDQYARSCDAAIRKTGARTILFSTWLGRGREGWDRVAEVYDRLGMRLGVPVAQVGRAWRLALERQPKLELYAADGEHASHLGAYLAACVLYPLLHDGRLAPIPSGESERLLHSIAAAA